MRHPEASSIVELNAEELEQVSGGFLFQAVGNALYAATYGVNAILNTPLINSVGVAFTKFGGPIGQVIHVVPDTLGYATFKAVEGVAKLIGGPNTGAALGPIPYHLEMHQSQGWGRLIFNKG